MRTDGYVMVGKTQGKPNKKPTLEHKHDSCQNDHRRG